jgi:hypothetical protein
VLDSHWCQHRVSLCRFTPDERAIDRLLERLLPALSKICRCPKPVKEAILASKPQDVRRMFD